MNRAVYLRDGAAVCAAGDSPDAIAEACLRPAPVPQRVRLETQTGGTELPYFPMPAAKDAPIATLAAMAETLLLDAGLGGAGGRGTGLFIGTSSGVIGADEAACARDHAAGRSLLPIPRPYIGDTAENLAARLGLHGPRHAVTTACAAGANALLYAAWMIREGLIDHALVCGTEIRNHISLLGFNSLLLVAPERCRPFDRLRAGVVLGETLGVLLLSAARDARTRWQALGGGTLCDTSHPTSPAPAKIAETLRLALADAQLDAADIVAIKAHGTGTPSNDLAEGLGIREVFGAGTPFTSIKPVFGHTLGACGVLETLAFTRCIERGWLPATGGFAEADAEIGLAPLAANAAAPDGPLLLNYFGFGGNNCSLILAPC